MSTQNYRTKTIFIERKNAAAENSWGVAIDIGYSGTKVFSPNCIACFPSYAIPVTGNLITSVDDDDAIYYKDGKIGTLWKVGRVAQNFISPQDPDTASMAIYGRQRYCNDMFLVLARTAMGIGATPNEYGNPSGKKLVVETGLPNTYLKYDYPILREVLTGTHVFDLKIGKGEWHHYVLKLDADNLKVMPQPLGTLISISTDEDGNMPKEAEKFYTGSLLICDPGFGTMDCFSFKASEMNGQETFDSLGMKQVMAETSARLFKDYGVEMPVPAMQKALEDGYVTKFDYIRRRGENIKFDDILEECSDMVAQRAIDKLFEVYNSMLDFQYLVLTGGTGEAWFPIFEKELAGIPNLSLIRGNLNTKGLGANGDELPFIFSNVRGYYLYLQRHLN